MKKAILPLDLVAGFTSFGVQAKADSLKSAPLIFKDEAEVKKSGQFFCGP